MPQSVIRQFFHHSSTPLLHKLLKFKKTKSPLGITKAGSSGPGCLFNYRFVNFIQSCFLNHRSFVNTVHF